MSEAYKTRDTEAIYFVTLTRRSLQTKPGGVKISGFYLILP